MSRVTSLTTAMQKIVNSFAVAIIVTILTTKSTDQAAAIAQGQTIDPDHPPASMLAAIINAAVKSFDETFGIKLFVSIGGIFF